MTRSNWSPIGIEVDGRYINAVQVSHSGRSSYRIEQATSIRRADPEVPLDAEEVQELARTLDRQGFRGQDVIMAMPPNHLMVDVMQLPTRGEPSAVQDLIRQEVVRSHRCEADSFELAYWDLPGPAPGAPANSVLAVACHHEHANAVLDVFEATGLQVSALDIHAWAVSRACRSVLEDAVNLTAIVDCAWTDTRLVVMCGENVVYERSLTDAGLNRLHLTLRNKLDLEEDVADYMLDEIGLGSRSAGEQADSELLEEVQDQLRKHVDKLISELKLSLAYIYQEYPERPVNQMVLIGDGAGIPELPAALSRAMGMDACSFAPNTAAPCRLAIEDLCRLPRMSVALGLALYPEKG